MSGRLQAWILAHPGRATVLFLASVVALAFALTAAFTGDGGLLLGLALPIAIVSAPIALMLFVSQFWLPLLRRSPVWARRARRMALATLLLFALGAAGASWSFFDVSSIDSSPLWFWFVWALFHPALARPSIVATAARVPSAPPTVATPR